jgi:tetratricopeptide (TPR) repeat protein
LGDLDKADALCQESWEICQELGYQKGAILAQISRGEIALEREEFQAARKNFQDSLEDSEKMGFVLGIMRNQIGLGRAAFGMGELKRAQSHLRRGLALGGESRQLQAELSTLLTLAKTLIASGDSQNGLMLLALAASHPAADLHTREKASGELETLEDSFTPSEFKSLVARGRELTLEAVREAQGDAG